MTKEYLKKYTHIKREVSQIEDEIEKIMAYLEKVTATLGKSISSGHKREDRTAKGIAELQDLRKRYSDKLSDMLDILRDIENAIGKLPEKERTVMRYRYIDNLLWDDIADKMHFSKRQVIRIEKAALKKLEKI